MLKYNKYLQKTSHFLILTIIFAFKKLTVRSQVIVKPVMAIVRPGILQVLKKSA